MVQGCEQVDLAAVGLGRSAKALAVDRQAAQSAPGSVPPVGEPAADCQVQCVAVDPGQQPSDRRFRGQGPSGEQGVESHADVFQYVGWSVGDPFTDRQHRRCPRQHRAGGQGKDADESVAHSTRITWIGHLGEAAQQSRHFFRRGLWMLSGLVKGRRDQR